MGHGDGDANTTTIYVAITLARERSDAAMASIPAIVADIQERLSQECFLAQGEDIWIAQMNQPHPAIFVAYSEDNAIEVSVDGMDPEQVVTFDYYMLETETDYEPEDYTRVIGKLEALPPGIRPNALIERLAAHRDQL